MASGISLGISLALADHSVTGGVSLTAYASVADAVAAAYAAGAEIYAPSGTYAAASTVPNFHDVRWRRRRVSTPLSLAGMPARSICLMFGWRDDDDDGRELRASGARGVISRAPNVTFSHIAISMV